MDRVHEFSEIYQLAIMELAYKGSSGFKLLISSLPIYRSGANFSHDFYSGYILAEINADIKERIKGTIPVKEANSMIFDQLQKKWDDEADKLYRTQHCENLSDKEN